MYDSWDLVALRTSVLTVPNHHFEEPAPDPTITQLLSMFASNPAHRKVWFLGVQSLTTVTVVARPPFESHSIT